MKLWLVVIAAVLAALAQTPAITDGGVVNLAGSGPLQVVAPGSLVAVFGSQLASKIAAANTIPLSTTLDDVTSVTFNGISAPLLFVSPSQINAQVPWEVQPGSASVVVTRTGGSSAPAAVQITPSAPGIFTINFSGRQALAVNNADGSIAGPPNLIPGLTSHPAKAGDTLVIFATGLGPVSPAAVTGNSSADTMRSTVDTPTVLVGGMPAQVSFSGLSPLLVGVNQLNVVVPSGVPAGNFVTLQLQMGDTTTTDQVTIAVQ